MVIEKGEVGGGKGGKAHREESNRCRKGDKGAVRVAELKHHFE